jgi:hypothetical protein
MPGEMIIAIVAIGCGTGLLFAVVETIKVAVLRRPLRGSDETIKALVEEVKQLRQQNNDLILALDTNMDRMDRRLSHLEARSSLGAGSTTEAEQMAVRRP